MEGNIQKQWNFAALSYFGLKLQVQNFHPPFLQNMIQFSVGRPLDISLRAHKLLQRSSAYAYDHNSKKQAEECIRKNIDNGVVMAVMVVQTPWPK